MTGAGAELGEEEGGPELGRVGGALGAWPPRPGSRGTVLLLARKPPSSSESVSAQARLGERTPRDWTRWLKDS